MSAWFNLELNLTNKCNLACKYCVTGDSQVILSNGKTKPIKDIEIGEKILSFEEYAERGKQNKLKEATVTEVFSRESEVVEIILEDGSKLNVTENHPILTGRGNNNWKKAGSLKVGEMVKKFPLKVENYQEDSDYLKGYVIAAILGDGLFRWYKDGNGYDAPRFRFVVKDIEVNKYFKESLESLGIKGLQERDFLISEKENLYVKAVYSNKKEIFKEIQNLIFKNFTHNNSTNYYRGFLAGIYDTEGSFSESLRISNFDEIILLEIARCLDNLNYPYIKEKNGIRIQSIKNKKKSRESFKFLLEMKPKCIRKNKKKFLNKSLLKRVKVVSIKKKGNFEVFNLETTSKTYFANNFAVHNCFENGCEVNKKTERDFDPDTFIKTAKEIIADERFESKYGGMRITFGGGEPTVCQDKMNYIVEELSKHRLIKGFFLYTNGYHIDPLLELASNYPVGFQISYDGGRTQVEKRVDRQGNSVAKTVRDNIIKAHKEGFNFNLKSVITFDTFHHLKDNYMDFLDLQMNEGIEQIGYNPSPDNIHTYVDFNLTNEFLEHIYDCMAELKPYERRFYKYNDRFLFRWFDRGRAVCGTGLNMFIIDIDGHIYPCHGCLYSPLKMEHQLAHIEDSNYISKMFRSTDMMNFIDFKNCIPDECKTCESEMCMRCNPVKHAHSEKSSYIEKWLDYAAQQDVCQIFRTSQRVRDELKEELNIQ